MRRRATEAEKNLRIDILALLKARGASPGQLVTYGMQQWGLSDRQVERYLSEAKERDKTIANQPLDDHLGSFLSDLRHLYTQAMLKDDLELARRVKSDQIKTVINFKTLNKNGGADASVCSEPEVSQQELDDLIASLEREGSR